MNRKTHLKIINLLALALLPATSAFAANPRTFTYTVPSNSKTSAGVYAATYDGAQVDSNKARTGAINADTGVLTIGRDDGQARYLKGVLDEARIYNTALSSSSITALYNETP